MKKNVEKKRAAKDATPIKEKVVDRWNAPAPPPRAPRRHALRTLRSPITSLAATRLNVDRTPAIGATDAMGAVDEPKPTSLVGPNRNFSVMSCRLGDEDGMREMHACILAGRELNGGSIGG